MWWPPTTRSFRCSERPDVVVTDVLYVGDEANPYNVFDVTLNRGREGRKET